MRVIGSATTGRDGLDGPDLGLQRILLGLSEHHDECDPGVVEPLLRLRNAARRLLEARVNPCVYLRLLARPTSLAGLYFRPTPTPPCPRWCCVDRLNLLPPLPLDQVHGSDCGASQEDLPHYNTLLGPW